VNVARESVYLFRPALPGFSLPSTALPAIAAAVDVALLLVASVVGATFYQLYLTNDDVTLDRAIAIGLMAGALFVILARPQGLYRFRALMAPVPRLPRVGVVTAVSLLAVICILFLLKVGSEYSRGVMMAFAVSALALVPAGRLAIGAATRYGIRRGSIRGRAVVTIGDPAEMERLSASDLLQVGIDEVARFALVGRAVVGGLSEKDRDRVAQAIDASRRMRAVEFALILPWSRDRELAEVRSLLRVSALPVRLYPDFKTRALFHQERERGVDPYFSIKIQREPLGPWERLFKRAMDVMVALSALIALAPLLVMTACLIKLDSRGPIIFRQRRCGFDNREFVMFKFRTMTVLEDDGRIVQARRNDSRVTRVGRVLRRTSIDELPQLFNVLRGEMSIVGPRPHALAHDDEYKASIRNYALRHHVKPGLTGAAQVAGLRGETRRLEQMERRVERDLWYINNWSPALDLRILAQTCVAMLRDEAY
jgi:undecaprenyl-phosphate galactose phosphotransferase/putative colanic acid biosynthesis UDP-glucose lipid carrier transferase